MWDECCYSEGPLHSAGGGDEDEVQPAFSKSPQMCS